MELEISGTNTVTTNGDFVKTPLITYRGFAEAVEKIYMSCEHCGMPLKRDQAYIFPGTVEARDNKTNRLMHKHCYSRNYGQRLNEIEKAEREKLGVSSRIK